MKTSLLLSVLIFAVAGLLSWRNAEVLHASERRAGELRREIEEGSNDSPVPGDKERRRQDGSGERRSDGADLARRILDFSRSRSHAFSDNVARSSREEELRQILLIEELNHLDGEGFEAFLTTVLDLSGGDEKLRATWLQTAMTRMAAQCPEAALHWLARDEVKQNPAISKSAAYSCASGALATLAEHDPAAAKRCMDEGLTGQVGLDGRGAALTILAGKARHNPEAALAEAFQTSTDAGQVITLGIAGNDRTPEDRTRLLVAVRDHLEELSDQDRKQTIDYVMSQFSRVILAEGFDRSADWLESAPMTPEEMGSFVQHLCYSDEDGRWLEWLEHHAPGQIGAEQAGNMMTTWAYLDRQAAEKWLTESKGGPLFDRATATFINVVKGADPVTAERWLNELPAGESRAQIGQSLYGTWKTKDPAAAAEFARRQGIPDP